MFARSNTSDVHTVFYKKLLISEFQFKHNSIVNVWTPCLAWNFSCNVRDELAMWITWLLHKFGFILCFFYLSAGWGWPTCSSPAGGSSESSALRRRSSQWCDCQPSSGKQGAADVTDAGSLLWDCAGGWAAAVHLQRPAEGIPPESAWENYIERVWQRPNITHAVTAGTMRWCKWFIWNTSKNWLSYFCSISWNYVSAGANT